MPALKTTALWAFVALLLALGSLPARANGIIRDEEIEQDLKRMCSPVFDQAGVSARDVRFILVDNDELNAFVAGGQNIFINTGLLLKTDNPSELVGVVAHETGHIALGHIFRSRSAVEDMSFQALLSNVLGIAAAAVTGSGEAGAAISQAGQHVALRNILSHSRMQESSADEAGVRFLTGAHLPLTGFLSFMEKLADQELLPDSEQTEYVRTHPLTQNRIDFLKNAVAQARPEQEPAGWSVLHGRIKAKLLGFLYPDRALQDKSDTSDARYARAIAYYRKGELDKSMAQLDPLIKEEPKNPWFQELKGQALFESGHIAEALPPYARAVELAPYSGLIRAAYGHVLLENKKLPEAVAELRRSLDAEPRQPGTYRLLAIAYGKQGQEGLSRLNLAEQYFLENKLDLAKTEAKLAQAALPQGASRLRAQDILDAIARKSGKKDKDNKDDGDGD